MSGTIRIGVGGWVHPDWRGLFYPPGLPQAKELAHAASHLSAIEINGTFYRTPEAETFARWRSEVPDGFRFALKAPRYATNRRVLAEAGDAVARFITAIAPLQDRIGPINWQLPPTKRFDAADMAAFLALLPRIVGSQPLAQAIEVRHPSFDDPAFIDLARAHGVAIVRAADSPYPLISADTADFVYARIMGTRAAEPSGYSPAALDDWAARVRGWAAGRDVWLFVIAGAKERNPAAAMALIERLRTQ